MKRCPQCNRTEPDDSLAFCRADGTALVSDSGADSSDSGTMKSPSAPAATEIETSILPHRTDADMSRPTAPTTVLPAQSIPCTTRELKRPRRRLVIAATGVLLVTAVVATAYFYLTRKGNAAITSIAVMPFVNESSNADVEYLSDGMTETLISSLSQLPNLNVRPRSSVFRYKGKETNPQTIGKELNVQAVLNGRVVQRGTELSLFVELIDVALDKVVWSQQYNRKQADLVSLQSDIARDVSTKLKTKLSGAEEAKVTRSGTADAEAYQAYLKGRYYWNRRTAESLRKAIEQFKLATDRDPNYAMAFAGLADCYALLSDYGGISILETIPQAKAYAERAIALDDQLAEPHATLGIINSQLWQWADYGKELKRSIELNPNYPTAFHWYSGFLMDMGRYDEAAVAIKRAHELDPLSGAINGTVCNIYQVQNNYEASLENARKMIELDPNFVFGYRELGVSYLRLGRNAEAVTALEKAAELGNRSGWILGDLGYVYAATGKRSEAIAVEKKLEELYARKQSNARYVAAVYAGLGEKDKAFAWLEKDFQTKNGRLSEIRWTIPFESLRDDPRFKDLLKRMGLPE